MSGKNFNGGPQLATQSAISQASLHAYPDREPFPFSNLGLYLYLMFEEGAGDDWWPSEDESAIPQRIGAATSASRRRSRRTGR
jgi:hypothetical protein